MRRITKNDPSRRGFTLLETIIVLAIIALLVGTASQLLRPPSGRLRLENAMRNFCAVLRATRERAIASNSEKSVVIDVFNKTYVSLVSANGKFPLDASIQLNVANTQLLSDTLGSIVFFPDGASTGGDIILKLQGMQVMISVNWLTGNTKCTIG